MNKIVALVPLYKNPEQAEKCGKALKKQTVEVPLLTWDNSEENIGFTKAVNCLLRTAIGIGYEYAIVLNQDCYLRPNAVEEMIKFMDSHPKCSIGGIKQLDANKTDQIVHGGCTDAFPLGRHISGTVRSGDCNVDKKMPWVNGACMVVRLRDVMEFGLMDERFFLIGSDSDWCYSARLRGKEVWYIAGAECLHEMGVSAKVNTELNSVKLSDMIKFKDKWISNDDFREMSLEVF